MHSFLSDCFSGMHILCCGSAIKTEPHKNKEELFQWLGSWSFFHLLKGKEEKRVFFPLLCFFPYQTIWDLSLNISVKLQNDKLTRESTGADGERKWCGVLAQYHKFLPSCFLTQVSKSLCLVALCNWHLIKSH